jgi:hypothetical protein
VRHWTRELILFNRLELWYCYIYSEYEVIVLQDKMNAKKKQFPTVLKDCLGIVSTACAKIGVARNTYYSWRKVDPGFAAECDDVDEDVLDLGESTLHELIKEKNVVATIFLLKTKGKKRGYIERNEFTGANGGPIQTEELSDSQIKLFERGIVNLEAAAVARYKASLEVTDGNNCVV